MKHDGPRAWTTVTDVRRQRACEQERALNAKRGARPSPWAGPDKYLQLFSSFLASTAPLAGSQSRLFRPGVSSDAASTLCPLTKAAGQGWGVLPRLWMAHSSGTHTAEVTTAILTRKQKSPEGVHSHICLFLQIYLSDIYALCNILGTYWWERTTKSHDKA